MTLRDLFRKSVELLWQHPRLLLPVLLADSLKYVLVVFERPVRTATITALSPRSVFGGYGGPETISWPVALVAGTMRSVTYLACIMGYVVALGILANWVPLAQSGTDSLVWRWPRGLRTGFIALLGCAVLCVILFCSLGPIMRTAISGIGSVYTSLGISVGIAILTFAWFLYPFVRANGPLEPPVVSRWSSSFLMLSGVVLSLAIEFELSRESGRDYGLALLLHQKIGWLIEFILSLVSAIPYALSFVGMSLRNEHADLSSSISVGEKICFESVD